MSVVNVKGTLVLNSLSNIFKGPVPDFANEHQFTSYC